jgi:colanic acid biosynthesis glycosyl transferase WcaI
MKSMKILFVSQYFHPETEIGGIRIAEIARHLRARGHEPTILTGLPNYPTGRLHADYRRRAWRGTFTEVVNGLRVVRVLLYPSHSKHSGPRLTNYLSFATAASIRSLFMRGFDVAVATSPPLTTGIPARVVSTLDRVPLILELRDLWPEAAVQLGYLTNPKIRATAYWLEHGLYRRASRIVCVSGGIRDAIVQRGVPAPKCVVLTNGIDVDLFSPDARDSAIEQLRAGDTTIGIYVGSLSAYHGLDHAIDLLEYLRQFPHVKIVFAGDGSAERDFRAAVAARHLDNAVLVGNVPRKRMPGLIAASDFCLAFVKESPFSRWLLSSKIFMYMACGRPIFAAAVGETRRVIEDAGAGIVQPPDADGIRRLALQIGGFARGDVDNRYGRNGRAYAVRCCSWDRIAGHYESVLTEAAGQATRCESRAGSEMAHD